MMTGGQESSDQKSLALPRHPPFLHARLISGGVECQFSLTRILVVVGTAGIALVVLAELVASENA
jgi:hypothetical protein